MIELWRPVGPQIFRQKLEAQRDPGILCVWVYRPEKPREKNM